MSDNEFEKGDAGSANITLVEAGRKKPGSLLMMKGEFPCKVTALSTAKPLDRDDSGVLQLLTPEGEMKEDVSLPKEAHLKDLEKLVREILAAGKRECLIVVQKWGEMEQMIAVREGNLRTFRCREMNLQKQDYLTN